MPTDVRESAAGSPRRRGRFAVGALIALLALTVAAERARWFPRLLGAPGVERAWIWSADPPRKVEPRAFFLARDFHLAAAPAAAAPVTLEVLGDPEYIVFLNGERVGSGRPAATPAIDRYPIAPLLRAGSNRLVLELRSPTGSGVATARVVDEEGRVLVAADESWVVYGSWWRGLFSGDPFYPTGQVATLSRTPFARWSAAALAPMRPRFDQIASVEPIPAAAWRRSPHDGWKQLPPEPPRKRHLGARIEVDFGREVVGYLQLVIDRREPAAGLLRFGSEPSTTTGWDPEVVVLTATGRNVWQDAVPRRFRYAELVGIEEVSRIGVLPVKDDALAALAPAPGDEGLLGVVPHPVRLPVVDEIWRAATAPKAAEPDAAENGVRRAGAGRKAAPAPGRAAHRRPVAS